MKIKPVKAWAVLHNGRILPGIYRSRRVALLARNAADIVPVLITPIERKPAKKKARKR